MRVRKIAILLAAIAPATHICRAQQLQSQPSGSGQRVFSLPGATLQKLRIEIAAGKVKDPALDQLREDAAAALERAPLTVTDKSFTPPSGDKHDYLSLAPYWWPDPTKPNGLPYIRRDGQTNPEIQRVQDHKNFGKLISTTHTLALAFYLFGDESYAAHATQLLRVWFFAPPTRMNPNLQFAQGIPGINTGRGTGLIETRDLYRLVDAVGLLGSSKAWTAADQKEMRDWCTRFLDWMQHSENGKAEAAAKNNHGTYYDVQVASLALFTGREDLAKRVLQSVPEKRIAIQIEPDGRQPLELERTKALGYSTMNLAGLFELAVLGESAGVDLWNSQTSDGRSVRKALDYLLPFVMGEQKWPYEQIVEYKVEELSPLLVTAAVKYNARRYQELAVKLDPGVVRRVDIFSLLWPAAR